MPRTSRLSTMAVFLLLSLILAPNRGAFVSNGIDGAAFDSARKLTSRQRSLLNTLSESNTEVLVRKNAVSMNDLRNLTLHTGDEFAILTRRGERLVIRGQGGAIPTLETTRATTLGQQGFRFSGHTHTPGFQAVGSPGDKAVLRAFGQRRSAVWGAQFGERPGVFYGNLGNRGQVLTFNFSLSCGICCKPTPLSIREKLKVKTRPS